MFIDIVCLKFVPLKLKNFKSNINQSISGLILEAQHIHTFGYICTYVENHSQLSYYYEL